MFKSWEPFRKVVKSWKGWFMCDLKLLLIVITGYLYKITLLSTIILFSTEENVHLFYNYSLNYQSTSNFSRLTSYYPCLFLHKKRRCQVLINDVSFTLSWIFDVWCLSIRTFHFNEWILTFHQHRVNLVLIEISV